MPGVATTDERRTQAALWVGALTVLWSVTVPPLVVWSFFASLSYGSTPDSQADEGVTGFFVAGFLTVLLPLAATIIALRGGRPVLGGICLVVTLVAFLFGGALVAGAALSQDRGHATAPDRAPVDRGGCQEHSGGDTRCPGG